MIGLIHTSLCAAFLVPVPGFPGLCPSMFFLFCPSTFPRKTLILPLNWSKQQFSTGYCLLQFSDKMWVFPAESTRTKTKTRKPLLVHNLEIPDLSLETQHKWKCGWAHSWIEEGISAKVEPLSVQFLKAHLPCPAYGHPRSQKVKWRYMLALGLLLRALVADLVWLTVCLTTSSFCLMHAMQS